MEDCNTLVSDCIVVSCCCQCLILQLVVFIFIHLPRKLARKTKEYAKKKLSRTRRKSKNHPQHRDGFVGFDNGRSVSMRILELEGYEVSKVHRWGSCLDEVEKVLGELSMKGEFAFGSFWGENQEQSVGLCSKCCRTLTKEEVLEFGSHHHVKFHFIEVVGPPFGPS
ncbi:hypothetical protein RND81_07G028400 [Saponaria officinalis]|uniref:Uncharacterized protein n=1 Tax=Saponaria officinalis TaxID=3572 RepID=A0AAW1JN45_SAPOF